MKDTLVSYADLSFMGGGLRVLVTRAGSKDIWPGLLISHNQS